MAKTYSEKLQSPLWQKKRLEILQRDGWKCRECGNDKDTLHVHHKRYIRNKEPWEYENTNFITLCYKCHDNEHKPVKSTEHIHITEPTIITEKELLLISYDSYYCQMGHSFVPAIIQWHYKLILELKKGAVVKFFEQHKDKISMDEIVEYLHETTHTECLKYNVKITNGKKIIYG